MKIKSKLLLSMAFTSLTLVSLNNYVDAKETSSKGEKPKVQNVEVDNRNYDKSSSKVKKEVMRTESATLNYINSLEGKGWDFDGYYGLIA